MPERARRDERGITVVEMVVVLAILSTAIALFASVLLSVQRNVAITADRSISNDAVRQALQQIDRQVRSGNVFFPPTDGDAITTCPAGAQCGMNVVIYTQTNADSQGFRCMQWRINGERLETRSWLPVNPAGTVTGWRLVTDHVVNAARTPPIAAFILHDPVSAGRLLTSRVVTNRSEGSGGDVEVVAAVNGRNTQYGLPTSQCAPSTVPAP